jgi:hypothetical protein
MWDLTQPAHSSVTWGSNIYASTIRNSGLVVVCPLDIVLQCVQDFKAGRVKIDVLVILGMSNMSR